MTPSHGPDEDPANGPSIYSRMDRTKTFLANIHAQVAPGCLHGEVQTKQKMTLLQYQRSGGIISSETVAKALDIPNWGTLEGNTEVEKWQSEQKMKMEFAEKMKELQLHFNRKAHRDRRRLARQDQPGRRQAGTNRHT